MQQRCDVGTPVRLSDVAAAAGVSVATVSAVSRGASGGSVRISDATRVKVLAAIDELGYRPNAAARSLRTQRTGLIAVVVPDITNPLFPQFIRAAQLRAERGGSHLMVWDSHNDAARERAALEALLDRRVDGVVLVSDFLSVDEVRPLLNAGIAVATTDRQLDLTEIDMVSEDLTGNAAVAVRHLVDLGHTRIGHLAGDRSSIVGESRVAGYCNVLEAAGLTLDESLIAGGAFTREAGRRGIHELMALADTPTAVFAANDVIAVGAMRACHDLGLDVPGQLSIVGIDNTPEADAMIPGLTTLDPSPTRIAERLVELVLARLDDRRGAPGVRELVEAALVTRGTTRRRELPAVEPNPAPTTHAPGGPNQ
jgi:DNA-binding LacI/PurR family transcriptional regulator